MRFLNSALLATLIFMSSVHAEEVLKKQIDHTTATTSDGRTIQVQINLPDSVFRHGPTVVLAPGAGYHMDLPLLTELAESLTSQGYVVYRFNWNYFSAEPKGEPTLDGEKEILDMQAVVALARQDARVDEERLLVAGKSLGSRIAYRVFQRDPALKALALLTPVCTSLYDDKDELRPVPVPSGEENYPGLASLSRPVLFATSDQDPNCQLTMLFDFLKPFGSRYPMTVVGGNHSWDVVKGVDDATNARNKANRAVGIGFVTHWLGMYL
jgi:dienelactone hydrolase